MRPAAWATHRTVAEHAVLQPALRWQGRRPLAPAASLEGHQRQGLKDQSKPSPYYLKVRVLTRSCALHHVRLQMSCCNTCHGVAFDAGHQSRSLLCLLSRDVLLLSAGFGFCCSSRCSAKASRRVRCSGRSSASLQRIAAAGVPHAGSGQTSGQQEPTAETSGPWG